MFGIGISITVSLAVIELGSCSLQCGISPRIVTLYSVPVGNTQARSGTHDISIGRQTDGSTGEYTDYK